MKKYLIIAVVVICFLAVGVVGVYLTKKFNEIPAPVVTTPIPVVKQIASVTYACNGGHTIDATYYEGTSTTPVTEGQPPTPTGSVDITLDQGKTMHLNQTISADGGRYTNTDESFVFWSKGRGVLVLENEKEGMYTGCIEIAPTQAGLNSVYQNGTIGYTLRYPEEFIVDEAYTYQALGPGRDILGTKLTIPANTATGTNLSPDSYISIESFTASTSATSTECAADIFLADTHAKAHIVTDKGIVYSVATSSDAGAGNRYDEKVYALPGTEPCVAVRYFVHYSAIENYGTSTVREFDEQALLNMFDLIRRTLIRK